ncbi:MAG: ABC transporter ATP-binding protein, partial [Phycisphaerales bacterium]|nr:ABC transporter ATP-binding protein [Phycisphaerales bacterium]
MGRDYPRPVPVGKYRRNEAFWRFARRMLRQRRTLVIAGVMATVSAMNMGVGLVGMVPVLNNILEDGDHSTLPKLATRLNEKLEGFATIPQAWIDHLPDSRYDAVVAVISVLGLLTIIGAFANFAHLYYAFTLSTRTVAEIRRTAYHHLVRLPLSVMVEGKSTDLVSRVVQDTAVLNNGFNALTGKAIAQLTKGVASLLAAFLISWKLSLVTCAVGPIIYIIIRKLGKQIRRASRGAMRGRARLLGAASEVVRGYRVVKVYTTERHELGRFTRINNQVLREQLRERTAKALASPLIEAVTIIILGILALIAMKWIIDDGVLDPSQFIMTLAALGVSGNALTPLSSVVQDIQKEDSAAQRIAEIIDMPGEEAGNERKARLPRHRESIVFRDVTFTYPTANDPALRHFDLEIEHGSTVAIVGPNGS